MNLSAAHMIARGRVQGVGFRFFVREQAKALGIRGWVKNLPDGSVEVLAEGEDGQVKRLVFWCKQGPPAAEVSRLVETSEQWEGEFVSFSILY